MSKQKKSLNYTARNLKMVDIVLTVMRKVDARKNVDETLLKF